MNDFDRIKRAFADLVNAVLPNVPALAKYAGRFVSQSGQAGDVTPDLADTVPGPVAAPFVYPFPGLEFTVDPGKTPRALFGFVSGDPTNPRIMFWEAPGLQNWILNADGKISIVAPAVNLGGDPGAAAVGRVGDQVQVTLDSTAAAGIISGMPGDPVVISVPITLTGTITAGSPVVKAS